MPHRRRRRGGAHALRARGGFRPPKPGQRIEGLTAIREALEGFAALRPTLTGEIERVIEAGDTALVLNRWTLEGVRPDDGSAVQLGGLSADVLRRHDDGTWGILIDNPWG